MPAVVKVDFPEIEGLGRLLLRQVMADIVKVVETKARELAPRGATGRLQKSIKGRVERGGERGVVAAKTRYAHLVHEGTGPHVIKARKSRYLSIRSGGARIARRSVSHPGAKGQPYLKDAVEQSRAETLRMLEAKGEQYLGEAL